MVKFDCVDCLAGLCSTVFCDEYDRKCPLIEKVIIEKENAPWWNGEIANARRLRRAAEKRWKRRRTEPLRNKYVEEKNKVNCLIRNAKIQYYKRKIEEAGINIVRIYSCLNLLIGRSKQQQRLPEGDSDLVLANRFSEFFDQKITKIYFSIPNTVNHKHYLPDVPFRNFCGFESVSIRQIEDIVDKAKKTFCGRDPFPINDIMGTDKKLQVINIYHRIVNLSISQGMFPTTEKIVEVKPTLKGKLDVQKLESYRPITNASFLAKVIEIVVKNQLCEHLERLNVIPDQQSAYREHHSVETTLCGIMDDMLGCLDEGRCGILVLLDLSAAFDTVDHELLIKDLIYMAIEGVALEWFKSYLSERKQYVTINGKISETRSLKRGVPQDKCFGPYFVLNLHV